MLAADAIIRTLASVNWIGDSHMKMDRPVFGQLLSVVQTWHQFWWTRAACEGCIRTRRCSHNSRSSPVRASRRP